MATCEKFSEVCGSIENLKTIILQIDKSNTEIQEEIIKSQFFVIGLMIFLFFLFGNALRCAMIEEFEIAKKVLFKDMSFLIKKNLIVATVATEEDLKIKIV